jgi:NADPH:quinone reductase-like Zn-dependent oxidoreductase
MRAVVVHQIGDPEALHPEIVDDPQPGPRQIVVQVRAAALNHRDLYICRGQYSGLRFPLIPGSDGAGIVESIGDGVTSIQPGAQVVINPSLDWGDDLRISGPQWRILGSPDNGTFAELVSVPAEAVFPLPQGLSYEDAAAIPLAGLTAYRAVVTRGQVQPGQTVLITGIGGGVATFALLIARHLGARVLVTSGSDEKLARARALGAETGFNYKTDDWVRLARTASGGRGPDLIFDGTGGRTFEQALDAVRSGGCIVSYGATTGLTPELTVRRIFWKHLDIRGTTMGSPDDFRGMLTLFGEGGIRPVVDQVFPLEETGAALQRMEAVAQFGKIVLRMN